MADFNFDNIPAPTVVEEIDETTLKTTRIDEFKALATSYASFLESDPIIKLIEHEVAGESKIRLRLNQVFQARLIALAEGTDLDQIAANVGVTRLVITEEDLTAIPVVEEELESDSDFRQRIFDKARGNTSETDGYYSFHAKTASSNVADVLVISPSAGVVTIYVQSRDNNGIPSASLLTTVEDYVTDVTEIVKIAGITLNVTAVVAKNIDIYGDVYLETGQSVDVFTNLSTTFTTAFTNRQKIGRDITESWVHKALMQDGVQRVEIFSDVGKTVPFTTVVVANNELPILNILSLANAGSDY